MASATRILFSFLWASRASSLPVGCVTPFDAPPPIKDLGVEKAQRTLRDIKGEALG